MARRKNTDKLKNPKPQSPSLEEWVGETDQEEKSEGTPVSNDPNMVMETPTSVYLTFAQKQELKVIAAVEGGNLSSLIRDSVQHWLTSRSVRYTVTKHE